MAEKAKVVIAMSGGVDSSVAAALLIESGYSVTGMMLKLWSDDCSEAENACCPPEAIAQARQVASLIGIPFYVLDARKIFKDQIVDQFIDGYGKGITPNPCFFCNRSIRWGFLLERGLDSGADKFATGHYARVEESNGKYLLKKGVDAKKDQSYILSGLNQYQLAHTLFPLGSLTKPEVRDLARKFDLPVAEKHDSQDLCFVGNGGYRDFLNRHAPGLFLPGNIRRLNGEIVGTHAGLANYTIGQRKGLGAGFSEPVYVIDKNTTTNELIIGFAGELGRSRFNVINPHWISGESPDLPLDCEVKIRYKAAIMKAKIFKASDTSVNIVVESPLRDITPGQIAVFYDSDTVIGSGMIMTSTYEGGKE